MRSAIILLLLWGLPGAFAGQTPDFEALGPVLHYEKTTGGILFRTAEARGSITFYRSSIARVRMHFGEDLLEDFSYAVTAEPKGVRWALEDDGASMTLRTDSLVVTLQKNPARLAFHTPDGRLICRQDTAFGIARQGTMVTAYHELLPGERFIGLGEKTGPLDKRGMAFTNWNTDDFAYEANADPLYASIPFFIGIHDSLCYGLFLDNTFESDFNFGASNDRFYSFGARDGDMDFYLFAGPTVPAVIRQYTWLTGRIPLPPKWALGYQQCRWSYYPDTMVLRIARTFREKNIPADVIYLDIDYMDNYKIFTWDPEHFPNPRGMINSLKAMGFHTTVIVDPGIKVEPGYRQYEEGIRDGLFLKYPDGSFYTGQVWPGWCHFPDFTDPAVRRRWGSWFEGYVDTGVEGFWNDMNEPATWGNRFPDLVRFSWEGRGASHLEAHNIYGLEMARATYEGVRPLMNGRRPLVLTRAAFAGVQRYSAVWTGDNNPTDEHMLLGVRMTCGLGLAGVPFAGVDVGGFSGDPTPELFARWISIGALTPFFRGHTMINSKPSEPWAFGKEVEQIAREYISFRYRLMPYLYSLFRRASVTGLPVVHPLAEYWPHDPHAYDRTFENEFLLGPSLLVAPVESTRDRARVYLPQGLWYDLRTGEAIRGQQVIEQAAPTGRLPLFVRGGALIPVHKTVQSTSDDPGDTLTLHVFYGPEGRRFSLYDDDGLTYTFEEDGFFRQVITFSPEEGFLAISAPEGNYRPGFKTLRLALHGFPEGLSYQVNRKKARTSRAAASGMLELSASGRGKVIILDLPFGKSARVTWQ